jgi:hypothetical protein
VAGYQLVDVGELEPEGPGGMVRKVRRALEGEEVELRPGRFVRVDATATRVPFSGDEGLELVTIGAPLDRRYEPPAWG